VAHNDAVTTTAALAPRSRVTWHVLPLPAVITVCFAVTVALEVATPPGTAGAALAPGLSWPYALLGCVYGALATLVLRRDPRQGFGWALAWLGLFWVLDALAQAYVQLGVRADGVAPAMNAALWFLNRAGAYLPASVAALVVLFPTGRHLPGRWGRASRAALAAMVAAATVVVIAPARGAGTRVPVPAGVDLDWGSLPMPEALASRAQLAVQVVTTVGFLVSVATVVVRYRRSRGLDRTRMRWLVWAVVAMTFLVALGVVIDGPGVRDVFTFAISVLPAVAMTVGILRPEVVVVEDLLSGTLVYGLLSSALVGLDLVVLAGITAVLGDAVDRQQTVLVALLLTALLYSPLRARLALVVRRFVLGTRAERYDAVAGLASSLESTDDGAEQLAAVAQAVAQAFRVRFVAVEVDRSGGEQLVATYGERPDHVRTLPIRYRDEVVGQLVLPAHGLRSRLTGRDEQLLGDLVRQAATAARTSRLAEQLQDSRERIVVAREEERRRIRRDLHDGLGPSLSGAVFQLESARLLVGRDPDAAASQLESTRTYLQEVIADVRRLVHDLRPPALDDRGLVAALCQNAERLSGDGLSVTVEAEPLGDLPAAAEVAAYRIAGEAVTNVVRHAAASRCVVTLRRAPDLLVLEVRDDGQGIPTELEAGVGLLSMRERAAELGGRTEVHCPADGGTVVRAELPLHPARSMP
jgi:signal transduction histidine kinase